MTTKDAIGDSGTDGVSHAPGGPGVPALGVDRQAPGVELARTETAVSGPIHDPKHVPPDRISAINARLASFLRMAPADLAVGGERSLADDLVICGILGGKDVGKSTLINTLAGRHISADAQEVGEGTANPIVYVHEDARATVADRLDRIAPQVPLTMCTHRAEAIRRAVLIDLPDFDSEFLEHVEQVRHVAPLLDRVLYVLTPRKIGDRAWVRMLPDVIKDPENVHCVLNKIDELLTDQDPFPSGNGDRASAFWSAQREWLLASLGRAGLSRSADHHFILAAKYPDAPGFAARVAWLWNDSDWQTFGADRAHVERVAGKNAEEVERLRACVLGPVSRDEARTIKQANRRREVSVHLKRLRSHYDLDRVAELLDSTCDADYHQALLNEAFGPAYCQEVASALIGRSRPDTQLADELLERRLARWPILGMVYTVCGWLPRLLARRSLSGGVPAAMAGADSFRVAGIGLAERIALMHARLHADHAALSTQFGLDESGDEQADQLAKGVRAKAEEMGRRLQEDLLDALDGDNRPVRRWKKAFVWGVLIWFPLLQPVSEGLLQMAADPGPGGLTLGLYRIVSALGPVHLLTGFAVVALIYVLLLTAMYGRCLAAVRQARRDGEASLHMAQTVDQLLLEEAVLPLTEPFRRRREQLQEIEESLRALA